MPNETRDVSPPRVVELELPVGEQGEVAGADHPLAVPQHELVGPEEPVARDRAVRIAEADEVDEVMRDPVAAPARRDADDLRFRPAELVGELVVDRLDVAPDGSYFVIATTGASRR